MPIQPIDIQVNMGQQTEVGRAQQVQQEQPVVQQSGLASEAEEQSRVHQTQVHTTEKSEGKRIEERGVGGRGGGRQRRRQRRREEEREEERVVAKDPDRGRIIDVVR